MINNRSGMFCPDGKRVYFDADILYQELFEIWTKRIKTKRYTYEAFVFERNAGEQLLKKAKELSDLSWRPGGFNVFKIHHPERIINAPIYADRIVETWITDKYIKPYVEPKVIANNMACQKGKGMKKAMVLLKEFLSRSFQLYGYDFYFLQYDVKGYYDNLAHDVIKKLFKDLPYEGFRLLCNIVDSWECTSDSCYAKDVYPDRRFGVPKGNLPSQWFGILYMNFADHMLQDMPNCLFTIRYMDDNISFFRSKRECREAKELIEKYLIDNKMGVKLHVHKTNYAPINRGFNFCGWHYSVGCDTGRIILHLKQTKKHEQKKKLKYFQKEYQRGNKSLIEVRDVFQGLDNYLSWGNTYNLRRSYIDRFAVTRSPDGLMPLPSGYTDEDAWHVAMEYANTLIDKEDSL